MTQTEHLQHVILGIVKDIDALCRENEIEYYLFGGSALGAKRHKGFIPWDDDLDIALLPAQYDRFIEICKQKLDKSKYTLQEGLVDWPEHFSKIRLKGTHIREYGEYYAGKDSDGIYVDVFRVDNAAPSKMGRRVQYFLGKLWLAYNMRCKGYKSDTTAKKIMSAVAGSLHFKPLKKLVVNTYLKYNHRETGWTSDVLGRTRMHNAFIPRSVYGNAVRVPFEDTLLPVHEDVDKYLRISYGDYMKLPPEDKRVGLHITEIDFGKY